jgi:hypothetical protein
MPTPSTPDAAALTQALTQALEQVLAPLARLCVAHGMRYAVAEELLKQAFVAAARAAQPGVPGQRDISRVSTATGLNRREVTRLTLAVPRPATQRRSPATEVFTRWLSDTKLRDRRGQPKPLPRQGRGSSFESLAHSVTRDVHPRSLLDELCRLGLAELDQTQDTVRLVRDAFVPREDHARMLGFLGANVGDHLAAAVANVTTDGKQHFEQAVFADELSEESMAEVRKLISAEWKSLLTAMVPKLEALIESDRKKKRVANRRLRIGLYTYQEPLALPAPEPEEP